MIACDKMPNLLTTRPLRTLHFMIMLYHKYAMDEAFPTVNGYTEAILNTERPSLSSIVIQIFD